MGDLAVVVSSKEKRLKAKVYMNGSYEGKTNPKGELTISDLEVGKEYIVRVEAEDYRPEEREIYVRKDTLVQINFEMKENISILNRIREYLDQSSLVAILVYASAFLILIYMGYKIFNSIHKRRSS